MIPINLSFSGLNSYQEPQLLDFTPMGLAGIFGIFGPTGAGKSTILDAITLALYGEVTRSKNKAQGVINAESTECKVAFSFRLGKDSYTIQRVLVREKGKPFSAKAKSCRLLRLEDEMVLASDKTEEVNKAVIGLLGLRSEDFIKSVALPQGQFDQFLRQTPSERGKMLEHLFGLSQYGQALQDKAKAYLEQLKARQEKTAFVLEQIGNCSPHRLKEEQTILAKANQQLELAKQDLDLALKEQQQQEALMLKQQDLESARKALEQLLDLGAEMQGKKQVLHWADQAETIRRPLEQVQTEYQSTLDLGKEVAAKALAMEKAEQQLQDQTQAYNTVLAEKEARYDGWVTAAQQLQASKIVAEKAAAYTQALTLAQVEEAKLLAAKTTLGQSLATNLSQLSQVATKTQALTAARLQNQEILSQRKQIQQAKVLWQTWQQHQEQQKLAQAQVTSQEQKLAGLAAKLAALWPSAAYQQLAATDTGSYLEEQVQLTGAIHSQSKRLEKEQLASVLAEQLGDGEACPVCGSTHHPHTAHPPCQGQDPSQTEAAYNQALAAYNQHQGLWETYVQEAALLKKELHPQLQQAQGAEQASLAPWQAWLGNNPPNHLEVLEKGLGQAEAHLLALDAALVKKAETKTLLEQVATGLQKQELALAISLANNQSQIRNLEENRKELGPVKTPLQIETELGQIEAAKGDLLKAEARLKTQVQQAVDQLAQEKTGHSLALGQEQSTKLAFEDLKVYLEEQSMLLGFASVNQAKKSLADSALKAKLKQELQDYENNLHQQRATIDQLQQQLSSANYQPMKAEGLAVALTQCQERQEALIGAIANQRVLVEQIDTNKALWQDLTQESKGLQTKVATTEELQRLIKGSSLVNFLAQEYLSQVVAGANQYLSSFSSGRFSLALQQLTPGAGLEFMLQDSFNGGEVRPINTMSGGEIFLASLALALALSTHIQLHGKYELGFFFLDEGFGTLDPEKLETLMNAMEKLPVSGRLVGIITHVSEVKNRLPYFWQVQPATISKGSQITWHTN